ncbi:uncharacterized protein LOC129754009 [Uranotaenia lowii]|uniref:uncharacterized protein LOC129754009 n=1 Tax=Uranotaenia lowii TaxID=190385 RepID=UPI00247A8333|nr:uncharacterized protein LOC129754009 [Uranotaenia lowii]
MDALFSLIEESTRALSCNEHVVICSIDIKSAYDNVQVEFLINELRALQVPECIVRNIYMLFEERILSTELEHSNTITRTTWKGLPQGSPLSPICFNVMLVKLLNSILQGVIKINYADDTTVAMRGRDLSECCNALQEAVDSLAQGITDLGFEISPNKSKCLIISKQQLEHPPDIFIHGQPVQYTRTLKLLGMHLTRNLSWSLHISKTKKKVTPFINFLRCISGQSWGAHPSSLIKVYKAGARSVIEYGSVFMAKLNQQDTLSLDRIQWACIRVCLGSTKTTHTGSLEVLAGLSPLKYRREMAVMRFINKRAHLQTWNELYVQPAMEPGSTNTGFQQAIRELNDFFPLQNTLQTHPCYPFPPNVRKYEVAVDLSVSALISQPRQESVRELVLNLLDEKYQGTLLLATDGSKDLANVGYAVVNNFNVPFATHKLCHAASIYTAELLAIRKAVQIAMEHPIGQFVIITDSMSCLTSLQSLKANSSYSMAWTLVQCFCTFRQRSSNTRGPVIGSSWQKVKLTTSTTCAEIRFCQEERRGGVV